MLQRLVVLVLLLLSVSLAQAATTPTTDFTDNGDGTVTHKITGLTWKRCVEGQTWTGSTCSGSPKKYSLKDAKALGTGGWGLPTKDQLMTIVGETDLYPSVNGTIFPSMESALYWTSSSEYRDYNWVIWLGNRYNDSYIGYGSYVYGLNKNSVLFVQGGQSSSGTTNAPPVASFVITPDSLSTLSVNLDATSSSDPDGTIASYAWSASDGQTASGKTASLTFDKAGTYTITLTVTDDKGATNSAAKTISVITASSTKERIAPSYVTLVDNFFTKRLQFLPEIEIFSENFNLGFDAFTKERHRGRTADIYFAIRAYFKDGSNVLYFLAENGDDSKPNIMRPYKTGVTLQRKIAFSYPLPIPRITKLNATGHSITKYDVLGGYVFSSGEDKGKVFLTGYKTKHGYLTDSSIPENEAQVAAYMADVSETFTTVGLKDVWPTVEAMIERIPKRPNKITALIGFKGLLVDKTKEVACKSIGPLMLHNGFGQEESDYIAKLCSCASDSTNPIKAVIDVDWLNRCSNDLGKLYDNSQEGKLEKTYCKDKFGSAACDNGMTAGIYFWGGVAVGALEPVKDVIESITSKLLFGSDE